ncbi:hypothetical protein [Dehalogenimonas sp. 4OHTPN]|uniref:Uncharacterized protein n=1 Tax=Dehalogenimonas sp. 4OHTPN TaxID=3166643 RepID=A0AAU8G8M6_9CHLR
MPSSGQTVPKTIKLKVLSSFIIMNVVCILPLMSLVFSQHFYDFSLGVLIFCYTTIILIFYSFLLNPALKNSSDYVSFANNVWRLIVAFLLYFAVIFYVQQYHSSIVNWAWWIHIMASAVSVVITYVVCKKYVYDQADDTIRNISNKLDTNLDTETASSFTENAINTLEKVRL